MAPGWGKGTRWVVETGVLRVQSEPSPPAAGGRAQGQRVHRSHGRSLREHGVCLKDTSSVPIVSTDHARCPQE